MSFRRKSNKNPDVVVVSGFFLLFVRMQQRFSCRKLWISLQGICVFDFWLGIKMCAVNKFENGTASWNVHFPLYLFNLISINEHFKTN